MKKMNHPVKIAVQIVKEISEQTEHMRQRNSNFVGVN
jgi:hypothetical protein